MKINEYKIRAIPDKHSYIEWNKVCFFWWKMGFEMKALKGLLWYTVSDGVLRLAYINDNWYKIISWWIWK